MSDDYGDDGEGWKMGVDAACFPTFVLQELQSGKWYAFAEREVKAFPAKARGYLSADIRGDVLHPIMVSRAKYVGTLRISPWFPHEHITDDDVVIPGLEGAHDPDDILLFMETPNPDKCLNSEVWVVFALHVSDVSDFELDQA